MQRPDPPLTERLQRLRAAADQARCIINAETFQAVLELFRACTSDRERLNALRGLAPEYGRPEFLLGVDPNGTPVYPGREVLKDFQETAGRFPEFETWFRVTVAEDGNTALLPARWLCHLAGFRHRAVHLFIDHPHRPDYTLVQVRALHKHAYPGCFDLPVAGHVVGLDTTRDALFKELEEELGLEQDAVCDLRPLDGYTCRDIGSDPQRHNVEFREVLACRLRRGSYAKIKFADREVAAICLFMRSELAAMLSIFPERIASGLAESFALYLERGAMTG